MLVAPPETIDMTASLSSLVVRSRSGICDVNTRLSICVFNVTDIFYRFLFVAKVVLRPECAKDTTSAALFRWVALGYQKTIG